MPAKNTVKIYTENSYFHVYNRGVEKRKIFLDKQDCAVFMHYLKLYLSSEDTIKNEALQGKVKSRFIKLNLSKEVDLIAFALMPNYFHLLLKQTSIDGITKLLKRVTTGYVMYFNKKHKRVGTLFQSIFKACPVTTDEYLLHLSRYIHLNPTKIKSELDFTLFSSYPNYLKMRNFEWVKCQEILNYFAESDSGKNDFTYKSFVEGYMNASEGQLGNLVLEDNCLEI